MKTYTSRQTDSWINLGFAERSTQVENTFHLDDYGVDAFDDIAPVFKW